MTARAGTILHVTNGDAAAERIRGGGVPGPVLPWRDVLHEGPVPAGLPSDELAEVRARFIAECGWGPHEVVRADFRERDRALARAAEHAEVVLWFEHDLYDQLQLVQLLDRLGDLPGPVSLVCIGEFPGVEPFHGLGQLTPEQAASLFPGRAPVTQDQVELGRAAWGAFRAPDPRGLERLLAGDTSALPFLAGALRRLLEEYPGARDGLSRTERQALAAVAEAGRAGPARLYAAVQAREERVFMGDSTFWTRLRGLARGRHPLLRTAGEGEELELTPWGERVLRGEADRVALEGIDRWIGGVHLDGPPPVWRWTGERLAEG